MRPERLVPAVTPGLKPRLIALVALALVFFMRRQRTFYWLTGEGRTIGWGEEPLWFPHEAAKFAGAPGHARAVPQLPQRPCLGLRVLPQPRAAEWPGRTVYTDPRLEVAGAELFEQYQTLGKNIQEDKAWVGGRAGPARAAPASWWITRTTPASAPA